MDEKAIRRALMTAKNLAIAVDPGFSRVRLPEPRLPAPLERASGGKTPSAVINDHEKPVYHTQEGMDAFKKWHEGSQVVDQYGRPKVMYHATRADFSDFDTKKSEMGSHFGSIAQVHDIGRTGKSVMPVYLSIKNPLRLTDKGWFGVNYVVPQLINKGLLSAEEANDMFGGDYTKASNLDLERVQNFIKSKGYDGIVYLNRGEGLNAAEGDRISQRELDEMRDEDVRYRYPSAEDSFIAFDPGQIKSAIGNDGSFDHPTDITKAEGGEVEEKDDDEGVFYPPGSPKYQTNLAAHMAGNHPIVPRSLYMGTMGDYDEFDMDRANIESDMGPGAYLSSEPEDVANNYAGLGADMRGKISRWLDDRGIHEDYQTMIDPPQNFAENFEMAHGRPLKDVLDELHHAMDIHHSGATMKMHVSLKNPVVLSTPEVDALHNGPQTTTWLNTLPRTNRKSSGALFEAFVKAADHYGVPKDMQHEVIQYLRENSAMNGLGHITAHDVEDAFDKTRIFDHEDEKGFVAPRTKKLMYQNLGHDGFIDATVYKKFGPRHHALAGDLPGMQGLKPDTIHFIVWKPEQLKSAIGNRGTFSRKNKKFTKAEGGEVERFARASGGSTMDPGWAEETRRHLAKLRNVYSVAARAARNLKQKYGKPEQMIAAIRNAPGVKPEELKWSRVEQEFAGKDRVSRDDLAEHFERSIPPITGDQTNRHATHTLPGGENYRAYVLTLDPDIIDPEHPGYEGMREDPFVKESHYSNPNVVASYRVKDRFDETANKRADTAAYRKLPKETIPVQWGTGPESMERKEIRAAKIGPGLYVHRPIDGSSEDRKKAWVLTHGPTGLKLISDLKSMDHVKKAAEAVQSMWGGIENQSEAEAREFANSEQGKAIGKELLRIRQEPLRKDTALHIDEIQSDWGQEVREAGGMRDTTKETSKEACDEFYNKLYANAKSIISGYQKYIEEAAKRVYPENKEAQDASVQYMTHRPLDGMPAHTFDAYWKSIRDLKEHRERNRGRMGYGGLPPPDSVMKHISSLGALVLDSTPYPDSHPFAGEKRSYRKVGTEMMFGGIESTDPFDREGERTRHGDYGSEPNDYQAHADALMDHYQRLDPEHLHPGVFRTVAHRLRSGAVEQRSLPPAAPHVGTTQGWTDLVLKHAINHAVKNGYSSIILSPGEVHAQRWNKLDRAGTIGLSKPSDIGTYTVVAHWNPMSDPDFNINVPNDAKVLKGRKEVERYLGRDTAAKLYGDAPLEQHEERTEDSGVTYLTSKERSTKYGYGGEGYREFYDEVVPKRLLALARMHDPNAQLEPISGYTSEFKGPLSALPGIRITPEMAESVKREGFPAYASGGAVPDPEESRSLDWYGLYSHAAESAEQMKQAEGPRDQMISTLKNMPGVKDEELRWARLDELPERVTRQDLADRLRKFMPPIYEINLSKSREGYDEDEDEDEMKEEGDFVHYEQYAYPGGTNYREKLLTMDSPAARSLYGVMTPYEPPHFDGEQNLVAHALLTERQGNAGKYLHIDELQSDWAQEGRKKGFVDNRPFAKKEKLLHRELRKDMEDKYREAYKNYLSGVTEGDNLTQSRYMGSEGIGGPLTRNPVMDLWDIIETHPDHTAHEALRKDPEFAEPISMFQKAKDVPFADIGNLRNKAWLKGKTVGPRRMPFEVFEHPDFDQLQDHFRKNPQLVDKLANIFINKRETIGNLRDKNPDQSFNRRILDAQSESDRANRNKRPAFPYVENTQSWVDRGLKSVFQDAAKNRYDYVTWSPGRVVADKYNLADKISHLDFSHNPNTQQWSLSGYKVPDFDEMEADEMSDEEFIRASEEAGQRFDHNAVPDDKLEQYVGGEVARRMRQAVADNPNKRQHRFMRDNLEVPHKGMHDFYDKILPKRALALAREHDPDAKIEIVPATPDHPESIHGFMSIRITPKMRESMMKKGFKAYRRGGTVEAVDAPMPVLDRDKAIRRAMMIAKAEGGPVAGGLSFPPEEAAFRLRTKLNREAAVAAGKKADPGLPSNERTVIRAPRAKKGEKQLPNFVTGNLTYRDWIDRHSRLMTPEEAHAFSKWYKEIHGEFMKYTNNNAHDASVLMRAWLVAQQNIAPAPAMSNVLLQREQILRGVPEGEMVAGGMPNPTQAARSVLRGEPIKAGVGRKIADFVDSAEGRNLRAYLGNDPQGGEPFVVDVHTARDAGLVDPALINHLRGLGYNEEDLAKVQHDFDASPSDAQYENRAEWGRNLTKHLNKIGWLGKKDWRPEEVQAVGWMGMTRLTRDAAETSVTGLAKNLRRVSFELSPGEGSPWADKYGEAFNGLPDQDKYAITDHMTKRAFELGNSIAQTYPVGLVQGTGAWEKYQNPSTVAQVLASAHGSETLANIIGHLLHQTEVWSNNVKPVTAGPKGFAIDFMENGSRNLADRNELQNFWQRVMDADDTHPNPDKKLIKGYQPITSPDGRVGVRVLIDKGGAATGQKLDQTLSPGGSIDTMLKGLPYDITSHLAEAEITKARNDWRTDKDGQAYLQRLRALTGRDLEPQLRHHGASLAQELERHLDQAYQGQGRSWRTAPQGQAQGSVTPPAFASGGSVDRALQIAMRARQGVRR